MLTAGLKMAFPRENNNLQLLSLNFWKFLYITSKNKLNSCSDAIMWKQYLHKFQALIFLSLFLSPLDLLLVWKLQHSMAHEKQITRMNIGDQLEPLIFSCITDTPIFIRVQCPYFSLAKTNTKLLPSKATEVQQPGHFHMQTIMLSEQCLGYL